MEGATPAECVVIDTNVLAVAEGLHPEASEGCVAACINLAREVDAGLPVAVDADRRIITEYVGKLGAASRRSGLGSKLALHLYRQWRNPAVCHVVEITPHEDDETFEEVPVALRDFDNDDQKFIAVAASEPCQPQIYTAVDGEWWVRQHDFVSAGIDVQFACPGDMRDRERHGTL